MNPIHPAASEGFSRGALAYAQGRPEYPVALLSWLRTALLLGETSVVAGLGAGSGKFTRLLMQVAARVEAVEPVDAMRAQLLQVIPNIRAVAGTAEATTLETGSVNAVVCAQKVERIDRQHPDLKGRDEITFPYRTHAYRCFRI